MKNIIKTFVVSCGIMMTTAYPVTKEIEIKFQLTADKLSELKTWLAKNAQDKGTQTQTEYYFDNPQKSFYFKSKDGFIDALTALRVRMTDKGHSVCYKSSNVDPITRKILSKDEYESKVSDGKTMIELFEKLGFTDKILVQKKRRTYLYNDLEIVIDDVEKCGTFVEVELKRGCPDEKQAWDYLYNFLKSIGITSFVQYHRSYIHMFTNPGYEFGEKVELKV